MAQHKRKPEHDEQDQTPAESRFVVHHHGQPPDKSPSLADTDVHGDPEEQDLCPGFFGILKAVREMLGLSQTDVAFYLGVSTTTISDWERMATLPYEQRKRLPSGPQVPVIAEHYGAWDFLDALKQALQCDVLRKVQLQSSAICQSCIAMQVMRELRRRKHWRRR